MSMINRLKSFLAAKAISRVEKWMGFPFTNPHFRYCFSQDGEDVVLMSLLDTPSKKGFYIDIGAHHPYRFSNTMLFYMKGWNGINIDATPGSMEPFRQSRPRDINIECAISAKSEDLQFYVFHEGALSTLNPEIAKERLAAGFPIDKIIPVQTKTLSSIFEEFVGSEQVIDFLTIDVEGMDFDILQTIDFHRIRPEFILIEELPLSFGVESFLTEKGYRLRAKTKFTGIYQRIGNHPAL